MALASFYENDGDGTESEPEVIGPPILVNRGDSDDDIVSQPSSESASAPSKPKQNTSSRYTYTVLCVDLLKTILTFIEKNMLKWLVIRCYDFVRLWYRYFF